ncbi:hypothetical protein D918_09107 [Trichuris suis]|nr:hypothetical protein D918_09107 [Trichuris suis]
MSHVILICKLLFLTMTTTFMVTAQIILEEIYPIAPIVPTVAPSLEAATLQQVILDSSDFRMVIKAMLQEIQFTMLLRERQGHHMTFIGIKEMIGESYAESREPESLDINKRLSHIYLSG